MAESGFQAKPVDAGLEWDDIVVVDTVNQARSLAGKVATTRPEGVERVRELQQITNRLRDVVPGWNRRLVEILRTIYVHDEALGGPWLTTPGPNMEKGARITGQGGYALKPVSPESESGV